MKKIPILAPSRQHLNGFLAANPWINPEHVVRVESGQDLHGHGGLVLALPDWQHSPSIARPRAILEFINGTGMQLVVVSGVYAEQADLGHIGRDPIGVV